MSSTSVSVPPPPERRVPVVVPMVPRLAEEGGGSGDAARGSGGVAGISPSILIIAVIVVVMLLASISIHYFIRSLCRHSSSSSGSSAPPLPLVAVRSSAVAPAAASVADRGKEAAAERERLIERLPLFTLASSLAALPRSSRDCAVCQCVFGGEDELRLLPACRHAFHARCVDPWLRANPSCPLCRASIALPYPPLPELLCIELGSVSSRRSTSSSSATVAAAPPDGAAAVRAYPLPSHPNPATEYLVEEDLQVVLKPPCATNPPLPTARITGEPSQQLATAAERGLQQQPSSSVTPTASFRSVGRSSSRWSNRWSSRWSSGRWSSRYDAGSVTAAATAEWWWDMDGGVAPAVSRRGEAEDGSAFYGFVRWLTGAY